MALIVSSTMAWADGQWTSGNCTVTLSGTTLTVSGNGATADYTGSNAPWHSVLPDGTSVIVEDGVTRIGNYFLYALEPENIKSVTLNGNSLTEIGEYAFSGTSITSISIPNSVTTIGNYAFSTCRLTSVTIPNSVESIGESVFHECVALETVAIGSGLQSIGAWAFTFCPIASITVDEGNTKYDSRDNCNAIIDSSLGELVLGCKNTVIPSTVTSIGTFAFALCSGLTDITIPSAVTSIGEGAFVSCEALKTVTVEATTLPTLGNLVFKSMFTGEVLAALEAIYVPAASVADYKAAANWIDYEAKIVGGWQLTIAPSEYGTFYCDQNAKLLGDNASNAEISTITALSGSTATTAVIEGTVKAETPILIKNTAETEQTFILVPTSDEASSVTAASEFKGTTTATTLEGKSKYVCNGLEFIEVDGSIEIPANRCWLALSTAAGSRSISIEGEGTTGIDKISADTLEGVYYDLSGRKLQGKPTKKGIYILNGRKVVLK